MRLGRVGDGDAAEPHHEHGREDRQGLAARANHPAIHPDQRGREDQDHEDNEEVREAVRILERVRGVDVKEAAAVAPEVLDRLHRRDGTLSDRLRNAADSVHRGVVREVLQHALRNEDQRGDERHRQQHVEDRAGNVGVEVAEVLAAATGDAADHRDGDGDTYGGGAELLHRQPEHLADVGHRVLAAVVLPVRVGEERGDGVERDVPWGRVELHPAVVVPGIERLGAQDQVEDQPARKREEEEALRIGLPVLFALSIDAEGAIEPPLEPAENRREEDALAHVDLGEVATNDRRQTDQQSAEDDDLQPAVDGHFAFLELLAAKQGVEEVGGDQYRDDEPKEVRGAHEGKRRSHTRSMPSISR